MNLSCKHQYENCILMAVKLAHLRTFVAIADAGGVGRAASRLNLTQPTASRQIHALEAELGVPLFDRVGRRVRLTSEGEDLLEGSRRLLSDADSLGERARSLKEGHIGMLRIAATPQAIESVLVDFLAHYRPRHPGVDVRLVEDGGLRLAGRLERGDVHLAIMWAGDERFRARLLYPSYVTAVLRQSHPLSRRTVLEISELAGEPLLLAARGFAYREWFHSACQVAQIRPRVFLESAAPQTLVALAAGGYGIAVITSSVLIPRGQGPRCPFGPPRRADRRMVYRRLGSAAVPRSIRAGAYRGTRRLYTAQLSEPRRRPAGAAVAPAEGIWGSESQEQASLWTSGSKLVRGPRIAERRGKKVVLSLVSTTGRHDILDDSHKKGAGLTSPSTKRT
jgi:LysR family cyn operon transcriptional activator